ncbi:MAG TPA: ATP-binding cassette domain-containing protein [Ohtaekwangia sp.]|uniref:ABC transporter ATP-binding protein n=1 Tax=Ohtaekwangia sp. TaxID=2066019 RepID=UPI002F91F2F7
MPVDPIILTDITHSFSTKPVLSGLSWSFAHEKVTVVLGKSGSGKSTLLQIINGMIRPDRGSVALFDAPLDYSNIHTIRLKLGYVIQHIGLFPHLTLYDNIVLPGKIAQQPAHKTHQRALHLLDMVELPISYIHKYPHELSGGEQQRAGLCRAMLLEPPVLLMDEPFASLDTDTKQSIYSHLKAIQRDEPRTIVLVSHDREEARILGDYFMALEDGTIKTSGAIANIDVLKSSLIA